MPSLYLYTLQSGADSTRRGKSRRRRLGSAAATPGVFVACDMAKTQRGVPYMPLSWGGLGGQCRHILHTWSVWRMGYIEMSVGRWH